VLVAFPVLTIRPAVDLIYQPTESDMPIAHEEAPDLSTPASTPNPLEPIMPMADATQWLREYFDREPAFTPGDDLGTCFYSYAAVMLCAMVIGTESPTVLAGATLYPEPFVAAVLNSMQRDHLWDLENVSALKALLQEKPSDWKELQEAVRDAMEFIWAAVWSPDARIALESLRRGVLFGGETQRWLDEDAAEFFDLA